MAAGTKRLILDASVTLAWCFEDEKTPYTESVLDRLASGWEADVPAIWPVEVANALLVAERKKRVTVAQIGTFLLRLKSLAIVAETAEFRIENVLSVARAGRLTAYDAAYLEASLHKSLPLATLDENLRKAAIAVGIAIFRPV